MNFTTPTYLEEHGFCNDSLWTNIELRPNSQIPVFTWCFQHTVLAGIPSFVFLITLPILYVQLSSDKNEVLPWSTLISVKQLIFKNVPVPIIEIVYPFVHALTLVGLFFATDECRKRGITSSGVIFIIWLLFVITSVPEFYAWLIVGSNPETVTLINDNVRYISFLVWFVLICLQLFLHCFADKSARMLRRKDNPEHEVSFLNRQFFWWFNPVVKIGHRKALEVKDLFNIEEEMQAQNLHKQWENAWTPVMAKYQREKLVYAGKNIAIKDEQMKEEVSVIVTSDDMAPLIKNKKKSSFYGSTTNNEIKNDTSATPPPPSIIWQLFLLFQWEFIGGTLVKVVSDFLQFVNPLLLNELITFVENPNAPLWFGFVLAVSMFIASELRSIFLNNYFYLMFRVGVKVQNILTVAVYDKALKLSNSARRDKTIGEIVNLMSIDVERFQQITPQIQQYWSSPLQIILSLFMLYQTIGFAFVGGIVVMILLIPLNFAVSIRYRKWQVEQMKLKDQRLNMSNEILGGIKVVKLYAWEIPMIQVITAIRKKEVAVIRKAMLLRYITDMINVSSPFMVSLVTFAVYVLTGNTLTPQIAFVSLTLFSLLRPPMMMLAELIGQTVQLIVSNRRLKNFFVTEELDPNAVQRDISPEYPRAIDIDAGYFKWDKTSRPNLRNITLHVPRGILVAVVGQVGSGKSSLLSALLGEMEKSQGYIGIRGKVAYVPQQSWIQNMTVRENITFQKPFDQGVYNKVIDACALKRDFEILPDGDSTEIGEKGINLSGGQKARISLARSLYQACDVYLLDDPLSAVDAIVGRHIFDQILGPNGMLKDATRILATHSITYLKEADLVVVMKDGIITHMGEFDDLLSDPDASQYLTSIELESTESAYSTELDNEEENDDEAKSLVESSAAGAASIVSRRKSTKGAAPIGSRRRSTKATSVKSARTGTSKKTEQAQKIPIKMIKEEYAETGNVKLSVYFQYFKAMHYFFFLAFLIIMISSSVAAVIRSFWLSAWSDDSAKNSSQQMPVGERLGVFAALGISETLFLGLSNACLVFGSVTASINLHQPLFYNLLRSPLSFFDVTPLGRVLNRLGKDIETVDLQLPGSFRMLVLATLSVLQVIVVISISTPIFIIVAILMFVFYIWILRYFITTARQLQRLTSINRSPIFAYFAESVQGASSIRAYNAVPSFFDHFCEKVNTFINVKYASLIANRWLAVRLEFIGNGVVLAAAVLAVVSKTTGVTAGVIGLSVSYSFNITYMLNMLIRQISDVETNIVAVERIKEYSETPNEANWTSLTPEDQPPPKWPTEGRISFVNYSTRYRPELDLSLRDLNIEIRNNEKVGIAGRTGAGKSSLSLALFRIIESAHGRIIIDGIDISKIGLHELRSRITIIPQDPVLFSGTLRFNLDPFNEYADGDLWSALDYAHLKNYFQSQSHGLHHVIAEGGENISIGQRQLVCLARAILRRSRVLVLDEATASIDVVTDSLIQRTIRDQFMDSTVITIAHRINTIMDYDRILVLDQGKVLEFDTPKNLLANKKSTFYSMVNTQD